MKTILLFFITCLLVQTGHAQMSSVEHIFNLASLTPAKFDYQLAEKGFAFSRKALQNDTVLNTYDYKKTKYLKSFDSVNRSITRADMGGESFITYETSSAEEYKNLKAQIKGAGFYCNSEEKGDSSGSLLYQKNDLTVVTTVKTVDTTTKYSLRFHKQILPKEKDIYYADDLLAFTSHEYLVYYFGEKNVKKDIYYLSGNQIARCSVLFLNTNRQVVFIWADEENRRNISSLLVGGQLNLKSSLDGGDYVSENNWILKSGVHPGMSLLQLRILNGNDLKISGGNSANSGAVIADEGGKLNLKKEEITLGCLNCDDKNFARAKEVNADESIREGRIFFVLSVGLNTSLK